MANLALYSQNPNGTTWADPSDPNYVVRFKTTQAPKSIGGHATKNVVHEIITNGTNPVPVGDGVVMDAVSARIRLSGALESRAVVAKMLRDTAATLESWDTENVFVGFQPATPPSRT
jgi:hypothetical protein